jgi:alpha-amylase/alpha-mannosidase (GH57 family)
MHQPFYKDLLSGEYKLPWTRMHALKDYYGMVRILEEFPGIRQTFNLVPSMMVQIEEYASGEARDPFLQLALKPAESLTPEEQAQILRHFFHANPSRMIYRYPRYKELYEASRVQKDSPNGIGLFGPQEYRDLQVLSQLAWFDEYYQENDKITAALIQKGRHYTLDDQAVVGQKEQELVRLVIPEYKKLATTGQIEISTTPFYHPILPLLCDSSIARVAHPGVPLPREFRYPEDARTQLVMAREYTERVFGVAPVGLWPSEGSVSDQVFEIAADVGFQWSATDNGILDRTLGYGAGVENTYRPWKWKQGSREMGVIFRDHLMSDLIGFVYSAMPPRDAAQDFLHRIRENCRGILSGGRDALVPIILDGENAWEYYDRAGRPFFRELYSGILADSQMEAIKVCEAFEKIQPSSLDHIFPGSWISSNFDVWIGDDEDNRAWDFLLAAREAYDEHNTLVPDAQRKIAFEELLIAEGSDWCWWYGPEHETANREEFDALFRAHIANVYRALDLEAPEDLSRPILRVDAAETQTSPSGPVNVTVDGVVSSYFEWLAAGLYQISARGGAMHGKRFLVKDVRYGSSDGKLFLRFDFAKGAEDLLQELEVRILVRTVEPPTEQTLHIVVMGGAATMMSGPRGVQCAYQDVLEVGIPIPVTSNEARFQASFWNDGLPIDAVPVQDWLTVSTPDTLDWVV